MGMVAIWERAKGFEPSTPTLARHAVSVHSCLLMSRMIDKILKLLSAR